MQFCVIDPVKKAATTIDTKTVADALPLAGLVRGKVDYGTVVHRDSEGGLGIVVHEFGLFTPSYQQKYFAIGPRLYAGGALLYAYDAGGVTIEFKVVDWQHVLSAIQWLESAATVELAISCGLVIRPQMAVNGEVLWTWPQPAPPGMGVRQ